MGIRSAWLQGPGSVLQAGRPLVPLLVTCSLGEEAASWTSSLLVAGCSRLCPLPRSTRSLGTGHPRVVTSGGGWTEEAFCLGCTFLPSLWGGQQRNPINTQCVGGGAGGGRQRLLSALLVSLGVHTAPFLGLGHSLRALGHEHTPASSSKALRQKNFKNPFISLLAHKSLVTCYFKVGNRGKEADLWTQVTDLICTGLFSVQSTFIPI